MTDPLAEPLGVVAARDLSVLPGGPPAPFAGSPMSVRSIAALRELPSHPLTA